RADENAKPLIVQPLQKGTRVPRAQNRKDQDQRNVKQCPSPPCNIRIKRVPSTAFHQRMTHCNKISSLHVLLCPLGEWRQIADLSLGTRLELVSTPLGREDHPPFIEARAFP